MNYRHAFHAGNFADVHKHAVLASVLAYLMRKPGPLRFIDTHAGIGLYDLTGAEASRTGEWREGIARLASAPMRPDVVAFMAPYLEALGPRESLATSYPGSPVIAQRLLRPIDRLTLCEAHPEDAETLRLTMGRDRRVSLRTGDGYAALQALVPPPERRGLVLIDPPFEAPDEFDRLAAALIRAYRKWPTGAYLLWLPLKDLAAVARFIGALVEAGIKRSLELRLSPGSSKAGGLSGSGLVLVNPPFTLEAEASLAMPWLAELLTREGARPVASVRWLLTE